MQYDVVIVGAGAAGLFCAMEAGKRGRSVLLLDKAKAPGEKIRISGGGRCNFTNIHASPAQYLSQNPRFCISALKRYSAADFIRMVEAHNIAYHEKTLGQLFCDGSSKQIIHMLTQQCHAAGVLLQLATYISEITALHPGFSLVLSDGKTVKCTALVIATGGPSIPKMGATGWGYDVAKQFGLTLIPPRPALVPFTLDEVKRETFKSLAGVAVPAIAKCGTQSFEEAMLFTHRGLSGPAMLQISSYWQEGLPLTINLGAQTDWLAQLKNHKHTTPKQDIQTALANLLPKRLAHYLCETYHVSGQLANLSDAHLLNIAEQMSAWRITPSGTEGYRTAEVTLGGVNTDELSSKTMECRNVSGLYFIGELVDVTGHLGGYNFQWAWSSGYAAGQHV